MKPAQMHRRALRRFAPLSLIPLGLLVVTVVYMLGMSQLEGETRDFWQSLAWASEALTTTGYGHDSHWQHPLMIAFVVAVRFAGVFLVFLLFPVLVIPFLEARFEERLPRTIPAKLRDFVLIYRYGDLFFDFDRDFEIRSDDSIYLCGSEDGVDKYFELYPETRAQPGVPSTPNEPIAPQRARRFSFPRSPAKWPCSRPPSSA